MATPSNWTNNHHRIDRPEFSVGEGNEGWVIMENDQVLMAECPCCGLSFKSARAAMITCEALYPPRSS